MYFSRLYSTHKRHNNIVILMGLDGIDTRVMIIMYISYSYGQQRCTWTHFGTYCNTCRYCALKNIYFNSDTCHLVVQSCVAERNSSAHVWFFFFNLKLICIIYIFFWLIERYHRIIALL